MRDYEVRHASLAILPQIVHHYVGLTYFSILHE